MDPLSQGVVGASLPLALKNNKKHVIWAGLFGLLGGMAPDLDILIRSEADPLLYLEFHRQFTHSFVFIPIGGLICAVFFHLILGRRWDVPFAKTFLFCTLGMATHGLLDAATSYGTQLFWPFTNMRVAFSFISIIDPLFTLPILILLIITVVSKNPKFARIAVAWGLFYMSLGAIQNYRAQSVGEALAAERGHTPEMLGAKPSFGNNLVWKIVYKSGTTYYVDAVRVGLTPKIFPGTSVEELNLERDFPWLKPGSLQAEDVERFRWFSNGYVAKDPSYPNRIIDLRYSLTPNKINGLWSIELSEETQDSEHVRFLTHRGEGGSRGGQLWDMLTKP